MFFLRIDVQGADVGHRLGLRIGEMAEQKRATPMTMSTTPSKVRLRMGFPRFDA